jgi:hypothetical protein
MAIVRTDPAAFGEANSVQVDSTAPDNMAAIHEIDAWAVENGFERVNEYWLRQRQLEDGRRVFRGVCIRLTAAELDARREENDRTARRVENMTSTPHLSSTS